ncbi:MAG: hypothetical protein M0028_10005 [Clostridia bacterium]|nr:hypothetical protein [Clostridia bacterium]
MGLGVSAPLRGLAEAATLRGKRFMVRRQIRTRMSIRGTSIAPDQDHGRTRGDSEQDQAGDI